MAAKRLADLIPIGILPEKLKLDFNFIFAAALAGPLEPLVSPATL